MSDRRCSTCGEWKYSDHRCAPAWLVWRPAHGEGFEDAAKVHAHTAEQAAEKSVERDDADGEYDCVRGETAFVHVVPRGEPEAAVQVFSVVGETVPEYRAEPRAPAQGRALCVVGEANRTTDGWTLELQDLHGEKLGTSHVCIKWPPRFGELAEFTQEDPPTLWWRDAAHQEQSVAMRRVEATT